MNDRNATIAAGVAIAVGLAIGGGLIAKGLVDVRTGARGVTVRGLAERDAKSDLAILPLKFAQSGDDLAATQGAIDGDVVKVQRVLRQQGFQPADIDIGRLQVIDNNAREYGVQNVRARFILTQSVVVRSGDVDRVQGATRALAALVREGVVLQDFRGASYRFTKLNDVRPAMIKEATASARTGAAQFAADSGSKLGGITSATQGSFEIIERDASPEDGPDASVAKRLRVVTTVTYALR
ncbi:SIMPL domain-containing protein [Phenylobacterium immobile]|uniref:SIMPL domain-containing protein n=1 Tax=Phenylobacterium immobile TaxID=21 RepID=UPI000A62C2BE|nr:SIMPL domain-containing protein [Phenylobacterium immobile]